ncbi:uncharacterized protein LOC112459979 [Temnothorax curvispinosus]|uniref:Uncharacterized protein LOC112459979 n=1 Tax=Temnothorax curvispinosus TaxID=300111 RepID=A0A6J1QCW0_9HYME|nr:uncharacterized protein LOC112459979 [Temnothorax curvispinosus]
MWDLGSRGAVVLSVTCGCVLIYNACSSTTVCCRRTRITFSVTCGRRFTSSARPSVSSTSTVPVTCVSSGTVRAVVTASVSLRSGWTGDARAIISSAATRTLPSAESRRRYRHRHRRRRRRPGNR